MISFSFSFPHHGKYSSYHHLLDFLNPGDRKVDASLPAACYSRYLNPRGIPLRTWRRFNESAAWKIAAWEDHDWVHYLYPEHTHFSGYKEKKRRNKRMLFSCHLRLGAVPLNWSVIPVSDKRLRKAGNLPNPESIVMLIGIGHPAGPTMMPISQRRQTGEILTVHNCEP